MRKSVFILFMGLLPLPSFSQEPVRPAKNLDTLLAERDKLYQDYVYYRDQKSSFWGTQSKNDLRLVIDVLKGMITKDTEIVEMVRVQDLRKESSYIGQSRETTDRIYALNAEVESLNTQLGKLRKQVKESQEELEQAQNGSKSFMILSIFLAIVCAGLLLYIRKVR